jgi:epoxide hydrolase-like predicted phosphatase
MTVSAVAFDLGGVLTHSALSGLDAYAADLGLSPGSLSRFFRGDPLMARLEVGEISSREFFKYVCVEAEAAHGVRIDIRRLAAAAAEGERLDPAMLDLVADVRRRCWTALITNNVAEAGWRSTFPFHLFDVVLDSSEVGLRKPDPPIYEALLTRLQCPAAEVALVDDFEENLEPAAALGLVTVHFTGRDACRLILTELGVLEPVAPPTGEQGDHAA